MRVQGCDAKLWHQPGALARFGLGCGLPSNAVRGAGTVQDAVDVFIFMSSLSMQEKNPNVHGAAMASMTGVCNMERLG